MKIVFIVIFAFLLISIFQVGGVENHGVVYGSVKDDWGNPVQKAKVVAVERIYVGYDYDFVHKTYTDENGKYFLTLPKGNYKISASRDDLNTPGRDYLSESEFVKVRDSDKKVDFKLKEAASYEIILKGLDSKFDPKLTFSISPTLNYSLTRYYTPKGYAFFFLTIPTQIDVYNRINFTIFAQEKITVFFQKEMRRGSFTTIDGTGGEYIKDLDHLIVQVKNEIGEPIKGAEIVPKYFDKYWKDTWRFTTNEYGIVDVLVDPSMGYALKVSCDYPETPWIDYMSMWFDNKGKLYTAGNVSITLHETIPINIFVVDERGNYINNAVVTPYYKTESEWHSTENFLTDENGVAEVWVDPEKRYAYKVRTRFLGEKLEFAPLWLDNSNTGYDPKDMRVEMKEAVELVVEVLDEGEKPIQEVKITLHYKDMEKWKSVLTYTTKFDGTAKIYLEPNKKYAFKIDYDYFSTSYFDPKKKEIHFMPLWVDNEGLGFEPKNFKITLNRAQSFNISVYDKEDNSLIGAKVTPYYKEGERWVPTKTYTTNNEGVAEIWIDPKKKYAFKIECDFPHTLKVDFLPTWFDNNEKGFDASNLAFTLEKTKRFLMVVKNESGVPIVGARVIPYYKIGNQFKEVGIFYTNKNGTAEINADTKRRYAFKIESDDPNTEKLEYLPLWDDNNGLLYEAELIRITLYSTEEFFVTAKNKIGKPIPNLKVNPFYKEGDNWIETKYYTTNKDGMTKIWVDPRKKYAFKILYSGNEYMPQWLDNNGEGFSVSEFVIVINKSSPYKITVTDELRNPIKNAKVYPYYKDMKGWRETRFYLTDENGVAEIWVSPEKIYAFKVEGDDLSTEKIDYMPVWLDNEGKGLEPQDMKVELHNTQSYKFRVVDEDGNPIEGAVITPYYLDLMFWRKTIDFLTDVGGIADIYIDPTKTYAFSIFFDDPNTEKLDFVSLWLDNNGVGLEPKNMEVVLKKTQPFKLIVVDEEGNPLKGAKVYPKYIEIRDRKKIWRDTRIFVTDENGVAEIWVDPEKRYGFRIENDVLESDFLDYMPIWLDNDGYGYKPQEMKVTLHKTQPFRIKVTDEDGNPLKGAAIFPKYLEITEKTETWKDIDTFITGEDGTAEMFLDPEKRYIFKIECDLYNTKKLDYMPIWIDNDGRGFEPQDMKAELHSTKLFKITVKDENNDPIHGAKVTPHYLDLIHWRETKSFTTDENGVAEIWVDPEKRYAFKIESDHPQTEKLDFSPLWSDNNNEGFEPKDMKFTLRKTKVFKISVSSTDIPLTNAIIDVYYFEDERWEHIETYFTNEAGVVEVWIDPTKRYAIKVSHDNPDTPYLDYMPVWKDNEGIGYTGGEVKVNLEKNQKFTLKVTDEDGNPIVDAKIYPEYYYIFWRKTIYFKTDENGVAEIWIDPEKIYAFYIVCDYRNTPGMDFLPLLLDNRGDGFSPTNLAEELLELEKSGDERIGKNGEIKLKKSGEIEFILYTDEEIRDIRKIVEVHYLEKISIEEIEVNYFVDKTFFGYRVRLILPVSENHYRLEMEGNYYEKSKLNNAGLGFKVTHGAKIQLISEEEEAGILIEKAEKAFDIKEFRKAKEYLYEAKRLTKDEKRIKKINYLLKEIERKETEERKTIEEYIFYLIIFLILLQIFIFSAMAILKKTRKRRKI